MAYVLLAVGALMSLAGAIAAINGYSIIQVEQGWSSVIAGATLFAGGIVTIGLALVTRALGQLQAALPRAMANSMAEFGAASELREPAFAPPHLPGEPKAEPAPAETYPPPLADMAETSVAAPVDAYAEHPLPEDSFVAPQPAAEPAPRATSLPSAASPSLSDDWFDRSFAPLDEPVAETPAARGRAEPKPAAPAGAGRGREPAYATAEAAAPAEVAPPVEEAGAPASAIIGRYEADETSYIMYADGSIEAQTHSGVYRFASMAELKAFIES